MCPAQVKAILDANVRTVEDLAVANESTLAAIGMGARSLKEKAQAWLDSASSTGKTAEELDELRKQVAGLNKQLETATKTIENLKSELQQAQVKEEA